MSYTQGRVTNPVLLCTSARMARVRVVQARSPKHDARTADSDAQCLYVDYTLRICTTKSQAQHETMR